MGVLPVVVQGTSIFLPQIIAGLGKFTVVQTNLRSVGPYLTSAVWAVGVSYSAWRFRIHGFLIAGSCVLSVIGYIIFLTSTVSFVALFSHTRFPCLPYIRFCRIRKSSTVLRSSPFRAPCRPDPYSYPRPSRALEHRRKELLPPRSSRPSVRSARSPRPGSTCRSSALDTFLYVDFRTFHNPARVNS